ncbi:MAG: hypothetical protein ACE5H4_06910 [Candidatus Thorarchaeota archaeon]
MSGKRPIKVLERALKRLRRDAVLILSEINLPTDLGEIEELLEEEEWLAGFDEHKILDLIRSLALIATALRQEVFTETSNQLIRVLKEELGEDEWEIDGQSRYLHEFISAKKPTF